MVSTQNTTIFHGISIWMVASSSQTMPKLLIFTLPPQPILPKSCISVKSSLIASGSSPKLGSHFQVLPFPLLLWAIHQQVLLFQSPKKYSECFSFQFLCHKHGVSHCGFSPSHCHTPLSALCSLGRLPLGHVLLTTAVGCLLSVPHCTQYKIHAPFQSHWPWQHETH